MKSPGLIHSNRAAFAWLAALLLLGFSAGAQDASAFVSYQYIISQANPTMDWLDPEIEATANLYAVWRGVPQNDLRKKIRSGSRGSNEGRIA